MRPILHHMRTSFIAFTPQFLSEFSPHLSTGVRQAGCTYPPCKWEQKHTKQQNVEQSRVRVDVCLNLQPPCRKRHPAVFSRREQKAQMGIGSCSKPDLVQLNLRICSKFLPAGCTHPTQQRYLGLCVVCFSKRLKSNEIPWRQIAP